MATQTGRGPRRARWVVLLATLTVAPASVAAGDRWIRLGDTAAWTRHCRIGNETRPGASCAGPAVARFDVTLPALRAGDRIEIAAALRRAPDADSRTGPTRIRAWLASNEGTLVATVWDRTLDPERGDDAGWHVTVAAVPEPIGDVRTLVLESDSASDDAAAPVAWARPVLRRGGDAPAVPGLTLVVLDGLRPDRVVDDGGPHRTTPILGRIARSGIVFTRAWAATPDVRASHAAMLTGRHPCERAGTRTGVTVATQLQADGWATAVVGDDAALARVAGFDRAWTVPPGAFVDAIRLADHWLGEIDGAPFLLVVQSAQIGRADLLPSTVRAKVEVAPSTSRADRERARYDASVTWTDDGLAGLLGALTRRRLVGRAPLVLTSAVGFALGEHGDFGLPRTVYAESLHVPLVVHHPALDRGRQVPFPVELRDLPRTLLELAGVTPDVATPGESLVPAMHGGTPAPRYVVGERLGAPPTTAVRTTRFAWLLDGERLALYDLAADPTEQTDIAAERPTVAADGRARIQAFRARCDQPR